MAGRGWAIVASWVRRRPFIYTCLGIAMVVPMVLQGKSMVLRSLKIDAKSYETLTFAACLPSLMNSVIVTRYKLTVWSWLAVNPHTRVILFVDQDFDPNGDLPEFIRNRFGTARVTYYRGVERDGNGDPLVSSVLGLGAALSRTKVMCFINPNVLVDGLWYKSVMTIFSRAVVLGLSTTGGLYVTGSTVDVTPTLNGVETPSEFDMVSRLFVGRTNCASPSASNYFVVPTQDTSIMFGDVPGFVVKGDLWSIYLDWIAHSHDCAVSIGMTAPVYRIWGSSELDEKSETNKETLLNEQALTANQQNAWPWDGSFWLRGMDEHNEWKEISPLVPIPQCPKGPRVMLIAPEIQMRFRDGPG